MQCQGGGGGIGTVGNECFMIFSNEGLWARMSKVTL